MTTDYNPQCMNVDGDCPDHGPHFGKYQSCLDESIHFASLEGADDEGGDVEGPGYFSLMLNMQHTTRHPTLTCEEAHENYPHMAYIVENHSSGAVYVSHYLSNEAAQTDWDAFIQPQIDEWYAQEEPW